MPWWWWLAPLACVTLYVWLEIVWGGFSRHRDADLRAQHRALDARAVTPPCALCGSARHTYMEHVRVPQAELVQREEDELWRCEGEW